jgi:hypothetical protein
MYRLLLLVFILGPSISNAQLQRPNIELQRNDGSTYLYGWAGALNNPQFSEVDIDADGIKDLLVFDKEGDKILTFKNHGTPNSIDYTYKPDWETLFPDSLGYFVLMRDFNCDGIEDIFSFYQNPQTGAAGIMLHRASRTANNLLEFELVTRALQYQEIGQTNLQNVFLTIIDLPAIDDIDGDGDLDILAFANGTGYLNWFSNQSVELGLGCDTMPLLLQDDCWGRFYESGLGASPSLSPQVDSCFGQPGWEPLRVASGVHAGTTLLTLDMDNDNAKELVLGNVTYSNLNLLYNSGNADTAFAASLDGNFPSTSLSVDIDFFPSAFYLDVNNDNVKDFIAAPNNYNLAVNDDVAWLYNNSGTTTQPNLNYQRADFLVDEMLELGTNAAPAFVDFNQDGLMDLVVGNYGLFVSSSTYRTKLVAFENIGTATQPIFRELDSDFANLQQFSFRRLVPTFGDLDNDGDEDIIIGQENGQLLYVQNTTTVVGNPTYATPLPFYDSIDVGQFATPQLVDVDRDGDLDLLIGERNGNLNYHENFGTASAPDFDASPNSFSFGLIDTRLPGALEGSSAPRLWDNNGSYVAIVGSESGEIWTYNNIDGNLSGAFSPLVTDFDQIDEGRQSIPAIADITNDGIPELVVGNKRGGLSIFSSNSITAVESTNRPSIAVNIFPNPTQKGIFLNISNVVIEDLQIELGDALGRKLNDYYFNNSENQIYLDLSDYSAGIYFIRLRLADQEQVLKVIRY